MRELLFKTANQEQHTFTLEVEETETIAQIKQKIEDRFGLAFEADEQVLFYNGRELDDALTVDNLNIESPNFIVVFVMNDLAGADEGEMMMQPMPVHMNGHPAAAQAGYVNNHAAQHHHHHQQQQQNGMHIDHNVWQQILAPVQQQVQLTAQDHQAIRRLTALGFPRNLSIEAYIVSDRNEEHAAEYILERMAEGHGP
ncbi:hypothetical protein niasHT_024495 [Heterodera trifolii]|uniref:UV excision repair protein RAD23 n=1 Tax=Heterodera trifolii TaxID=157864 RepID=A0ABD2K760_9BILA